MRKNHLFYLFFLFTLPTFAQELAPLTVEKVMRDPVWMGVSPENIRWSPDSKNIFFTWNPEKEERSSLYRISLKNQQPEKASLEEEKELRTSGFVYSKDRKTAVYEKGGDLFLYQAQTGISKALTQTVSREFSPVFSKDEQQVFFQEGENLFSLNLQDNRITQLTNFSRASQKSSPTLSSQDQWLKEDQLDLFDILKKNQREKEHAQKTREKFQENQPKEIHLKEEDRLGNLRVSPDGRYVTYQIITPAKGNKNTMVPNYVTESGYTEPIPTRTKVGNQFSEFTNFIYDRQRDSVYTLSAKNLPGIKTIPQYFQDYPETLARKKEENADRPVTFYGPYWNPSGTAAMMTAYSQDNKDRWILTLNAETASLELIDHQRDEAWIGGPGISPYSPSIGWISDEQVYFQSEETGFSHLYSYDLKARSKQQLTNGNFEIQSVQLSQDRTHFYLSSNKEHPGITHFYKLPTKGGQMLQLTQMKGGNEVQLSPDEKWLAIRYSSSTTPWELYIQENKAGAKPVQITQSTSEEFRSYPWRDPDMVVFKNRHGKDVHARVYRPSQPHPSKPAVVFVHGAGYLQNVHYWWSSYFREYMFNNLLADQGYTVIDIDYTASSGYGRDHRTGIYRHMGGKDLTDQVDGVKYLVDNYGINPKNVGLYGGSYGGFITLMALFKESDVFKAGGALRSVTDWAHYNHGYTSNILNEPANDPLAYKRSSPIYFADGLKGNLLMAHGMLDVNVHFQDIVRLSQRFIELGKDNWELAVYPIEDHGFVEPSSWTDEYKRIFKLFEETLKD